ncbi:alpha/beta hydrolase [Floricoccus penangensis]|uniref:alpha/beta hydrolase n=1 Tax=Floricoccus penangensis TaxID=1859475 RepID=UPI0020413AEB|nr:alpha/beta hydrolase [Floricoccus penangensis]URZ88278.1 alpha/beta hydrolase [Floricoccus penangensis]
MKIFLIIVVVILLIIFALLLYAGSFLANAVMDRDNNWYSKMGHSLANPDVFDVAEDDPYAIIENNQNKVANDFWDKNLTEQVTITSFDGLKLVGNVFKLNPDSNKWLLGVHGYRSTGRRDMQVIMEHLARSGQYNILIPDHRAHGESEGTLITFGYNEKKDILQWTSELLKKEPNAEIVLYGGSMGATTVMLTTELDLPTNVKGIIADCGYTSAYMEFELLIKNGLKIPSFPLLNFMDFFVRIKGNFSLKDVDVRPGLNENILPFLVIHGTGDKFVDVSMAKLNFDADKGPKDMLIVKDAPHLSSYIYDEDDYFKTVNTFLDNLVWKKG